MPAPFRDRADAGKRLAGLLREFAHRDDLVVLGLPRGGVPVAHEVARALGAPLDVFVVRKLGLPGHDELAMGAIATGGVRLVNDDVVTAFGVSENEIARVTEREQRELERRERLYRGEGRAPPVVAGRTVLLVDDGLATGASMRAAVEAVRAQRPTAIVVAVPVAPAESCDALHHVADDVVCALTPADFDAVGLWYDDFRQTTDEEVHALLARSRT
jgi:predicted phosphoribosyltransferase